MTDIVWISKYIFEAWKKQCVKSEIRKFSLTLLLIFTIFHFDAKISQSSRIIPFDLEHP